MTPQDVLYEYRYWIFGIAVVLVLGVFALIRSNWLLRQRTLLLVENKRKLDFQNLALDEHAIVSTADVKGNITYVNDKFCEISGYSREELLGQNHRLLKSDEHSAEFYKNLWRTIGNGKPWHGEIKDIKKGDGYYWVEASIVPILNKQDKPIEYIGIRTDITAPKDAEKEKREVATQEARQYKSTLELTENEIYMACPDSLKFFYANQAAKDKFGWNDDEFLNMTPLDLGLEFEKTELRDMLGPLILGKQKSLTFTSVRQIRDGEMQPVEINLQYLEPIGEKPRLVVIAKDITERQKVDRAKAEFISTVSHELRTPLTSIKAVLGLIMAGTFDKSPEKLLPMAKIALENSDRLNMLIDDLLDVERIDAGKLTFNMAHTNLQLLLEEAIMANEGYADKYGVTLVNTDSDPSLVVNADWDRMMQVMANLLSNAAKFSPPGGEIEVSVLRHNERIRIAVKDYGSGIPEKARATIFDRFTQADSSDRRAKGGTGLGLSITKTIVEGHGGTINFTSEMGEGTTFYIDLEDAEAACEQQTFEFGT